MPLTSNLEQFNQNWANLFVKEKKALYPLFGKDIIDIHHVGSTSIPGMLAKPEIDILVVLRPESDFSCYFLKIESLGYNFRGEESGHPGHWYFSKNKDNIRTHKLHLCGLEHPCVKEQLLFRDYLKSYPERAKKYSELKKKLADINTSGMAEYLAKKSPFIEETLKLAREKNWYSKNKSR